MKFKKTKMPKPRHPVPPPNKVHKDETAYTRKPKHKKDILDDKE